MRDDTRAFLQPREERVEVGGRAFTVREMPCATDVAAFTVQQDFNFKFLVRCVFAEDGQPEFTDADIPALKAAPFLKLQPLIQAMNRVMGFDTAAEIKNSEAGPSAG